MTISFNPDDWTGSLCAGRVDEYMTANLPSDPLERHDRARDLCRGCPVFKLCERTAYDSDWSGMVAAAVPIPDYSEGMGALKAARNRLKRQIQGLPPKPILRSQEPKQATRTEVAPCARCSESLRPPKTKLAEYPDTKAEHSRGLCTRCYHMARTQGRLADYARAGSALHSV